MGFLMAGFVLGGQSSWERCGALCVLGACLGMIVLVGMPGCGKSTLGQMLARKMSTVFMDSDHLIENKIGCTIREYFGKEGEKAFRDIEASVLLELLSSKSKGVLATGGGAVLRPENRACMHTAAQVVYLHISPEEIARRLRHDTKRPLLQVPNPLAKLHELYAERDPLYRQTAHFVIDAGRGTAATVVNMIMMQLEQAQLARGAGGSTAADQCNP